MPEAFYEPPQPRLTRRAFLRRLRFAVPGAAFASVGWMRLAEPEWLRVSRHTVAVGGKGREPLRILHLSDFHASASVRLGFINEAVEQGLLLRPDLICLTGDFITDIYEHWDEYARILARLSDAAPTFACLGNHDGGRWISTPRPSLRFWREVGYRDAGHVRQLLARADVRLLDNASQPLRVRDWKLQVAGVSDLWNDELQPAAAFAGGRDEESTVLLLCHNPDAKTHVAPYPWDVMLCGHTHGGQCRLPFLGTPFAPVRDHRFVEGLHRWRERWIHVTRGVGNLHGLRFNCRPEVSLLTLV